MSSEFCMDGKTWERSSPFGAPRPKNGPRSQSVLARYDGEGTVTGLRFVGGAGCRAFAGQSLHRFNYMNVLTFCFL